MNEFASLIQRLTRENVKFVIVGGVAATIHGSSRLTADLDVVYARDVKNLEALVAALEDVHPRLRGAPPGLPFKLDAPTLRAGLNFTLVTDAGPIDLLGEIAGAGRYENIVGSSMEVTLFGLECRCADLQTLLQSKRAAGRPKDFEVVAELEAIHDLNNS